MMRYIDIDIFNYKMEFLYFVLRNCDRLNSKIFNIFLNILHILRYWNETV